MARSGKAAPVKGARQFHPRTTLDNDFEGNTGLVSAHSPLANSFISCGGAAVHIFARVAPPDNVITVRGNRFIKNVLAQSVIGAGGQGAISGGGAGAMYAARCNTVIFEKNIVRGNVAVENVCLSGSGAFGGGQGGGLVVQASQSGTVNHNEKIGKASGRGR